MTNLLNIDANTVAAQATNAANIAKDAYLTKWKEATGGNEYGEPMYCGFGWVQCTPCLLYTSPSPRDRTRSRMPSSA